ncbi:MAG TPA: type II CAAX endopeptidase family protein [Gammaproteobacteria bacterium]|nr:type II CAAX endopeptidase family protein [Gammaproteobacteria bacterium]
MSVTTAVNYQTGKFWRFLQFPVVRLFLAVGSVIGFIIGLQSVAHAVHIKPGTIASYILGLLLIVGVCGVYAAYVRLIEKRSVSEFGQHRAIPEISKGFLVGILLFCLVMLILWLLGSLKISGMNPWSVMITPLIGALVAGFIEEILIRGILFRIIEESLGTWIALTASAVIFGLLHMFNPGATLVSTVAIALEAGILLAAVYIYTRRLWMVIGLHIAWNFTEGGIFGASVSGGTDHGLFNSQFYGANLITGGHFGPEASVVAVVICLAAGVVYLVLAYRKGNFVRPYWRRSRSRYNAHAVYEAN